MPTDETNIALIIQRLNTLEEDVKDLKSLRDAILRLTFTVDSLNKNLDKLDKAVQSIQAEDGKSYSQIKTTTITAIVSTVIGFIFAKLGMK